MRTFRSKNSVQHRVKAGKTYLERRLFVVILIINIESKSVIQIYKERNKNLRHLLEYQGLSSPSIDVKQW